MSYKREHQYRADQTAKGTQAASQLAPGAMTLVEAQLGAIQRKEASAERQDENDRSSPRSSKPDPWANIDTLHLEPGETLDAFSDVIRGIAVQRKTEHEAGANVVTQGATQALERASLDGGGPLPGNLRERFESSLGADLSAVRVHTNSASESAAAAVGAKAYTTGQDIYFAAGTYDPSSTAGQQLIAHEVAHTVQQSGASKGGPQFKLNISQPHDSHEHEADRAAEAMVTGKAASVARGSVTGVLARQEAEGAREASGTPLVGAPTASDYWAAQAQGSQPQQDSDLQQSVPPETGPGQVAVPAPFDIPVVEQCMLPPSPRDWSVTAAIGACPTEPMVGGPAYKRTYAAPNLDTYKSAFNTSWSELQTGYNVVVDLNRSYELSEKEIIPLLHVGDGAVVSGGGQNATKSFDGDKLKPATATINSEKVNRKPGLREQLLAAKDKIDSSQSAVRVQVITGEQANGELIKACNAVDTATNNVQLVTIEHQIADAQLDKEQVKRDLENYKADIKATVESLKMASALWSAWANPTKIFDAFNQTMNAGGALAERDATHDANEKLAAIDRKIGRLQRSKFGLLLANAQNVLSSALVDMKNRLGDLKKASEGLNDRKREYVRAYRDMARLMEQAGTASGMKGKDAKALAAAVEALPKIEAITQQLQSMDAGVAVPKYSEASGIGAAMCSNLGAFTHALSVIKGNKDYIAELQAIWVGRKASVLATIDKALTVEGADW